VAAALYQLYMSFSLIWNMTGLIVSA